MSLLRLEGGQIATLTLNRPDKLNALTMDMLDELEAHLLALARDKEVRVVLLKAEGRAFCVGADIHTWTSLEPLEMWRVWTRRGHEVFGRLAALPQPVIAVIQGYAFGGGLELALAADVRLASESAAFAMPETGLATLPGWGGTERLPKLVSVARAKQMIFSGERVSAEKAAKWGLVNEVLPEVELSGRADELSSRIAANAPLAVQMAKQILNVEQSGPLTEALAGGLSAFTQDAKEGLEAFAKKRSPRFEGK